MERLWIASELLKLLSPAAGVTGDGVGEGECGSRGRKGT